MAQRRPAPITDQFRENAALKPVKPPETPVQPQTGRGLGKLILNVVSQCKHQGGISMAELKQTLAAGGYDVSKNGRRLNVETKRLVNNETLVRTTRNTTFRLNNKVRQQVQRRRRQPARR
uniref:H15 domain-containing protein n=1 Tax=Stegastes partitus TaxID=144197 RepID=A0A3B4ZLC1_9TELE